MEGADEVRSVKHNTLAGVLEHNSSNHSYENVSFRNLFAEKLVALFEFMYVAGQLVEEYWLFY